MANKIIPLCNDNGIFIFLVRFNYVIVRFNYVIFSYYDQIKKRRQVMTPSDASNQPRLTQRTTWLDFRHPMHKTALLQLHCSIRKATDCSVVFFLPVSLCLANIIAN